MSEGRLTEHVPNAVLLRDGKVLVAGGFGLNGQLASVEIYSPGEGIFIPSGNMAVKRACHTLTLLQNGKVLIAGGYEDNSGHLAIAEVYDPETGTSFLTDNMKAPHFLHTATLLPNLNGKVLIVGGYSPLAEIYDPNTNVFSVFGELVTSRTLHTTSLLPNGQLLIIGGANDKGHSQATIEHSNISYPELL
jgi:WD40 repeat protein